MNSTAPLLVCWLTRARASPYNGLWRAPLVELQEAFISELVGRSVELWTDGSSMPIGSVQDLVADGRENFPPITGLYVKCRDGIIRYAPFSAVRAMSDKAII